MEKQDEPESDTNALTGKIFVVVLALLDGALRKQKVHLTPEELQIKTTRAVSQLLLSSTGILDMSSISPEMPSSLTSETDLDSMLEAMAHSGFPLDLMRSLLDATSRDIVNMIQGKIRKVHHPLISDTAKDSVMKHIFHRINEKVKMFFEGFKQIMKKRSTELQQNTVLSSSASQTSLIEDLTVTNNQILKPAESLQTEDSQIPPGTQADIDSCKDDIIYNILDLYKKEVHLVEFSSPDECKVIKELKRLVRANGQLSLLDVRQEAIKWMEEDRFGHGRSRPTAAYNGEGGFTLQCDAVVSHSVELAELKDIVVKQQAQLDMLTRHLVPSNNSLRPTPTRVSRYKRTRDGQPVCLRCDRPGHIARYCPADPPPSNNRPIPPASSGRASSQSEN
ncbi:hypothetical protein SRHO_G00048850 [Serrasalmus rhombeus]